MRLSLILILLLNMCTPYIYAGKPGHKPIIWDTDIKLPSADKESENPGVAGVFSGVIGNNLLIMGGANFPDQMPWEGGIKQWWSTLYAFNLIEETWSVVPDFLPAPLAYGISIQLPDEILCIGGCDANVCYPEVWSITEGHGKWKINRNWPPLPFGLACGTGVLCEDKIYIFGGQTSMKQQIATSHTLVLDLSAKEKGWQTLPSWPGEPKGYAVSAALNGKVYLFSGRNYDDKGLLKVHTDGFVFTPQTQTWEKLSGYFPFMAGTTFTDEKETILFTGGVEEALPTTPDHPGFSRKIISYNVKTKEITKWGESPYPIPVTTNLITQNDTIYITSGEIRPGVRTPLILRGILQ